MARKPPPDEQMRECWKDLPSEIKQNLCIVFAAAGKALCRVRFQQPCRQKVAVVRTDASEG
jgi:hypothetical protein